MLFSQLDENKENGHDEDAPIKDEEDDDEETLITSDTKNDDDGQLGIYMISFPRFISFVLFNF